MALTLRLLLLAAGLMAGCGVALLLALPCLLCMNAAVLVAGGPMGGGGVEAKRVRQRGGLADEEAPAFGSTATA